MKKILCLVMAVAMLAGMAVLTASCGGGNNSSTNTPANTPANTPENTPANAPAKLICGVTEYEPMNYRDASGNWTGFDTEFAQLVGAKLGLEVEFQLIEWSNKFLELDSGAIDAIWNGFTATATESDGTPRARLCDMSYSYMTNTQAVVIRASRTGEFTSLADLVGKTLAVEAGSAGETMAQDLVGDGGTVIGATAQISTFMEVKSGAVDGAVIDIILAQQIAGTGDFADLVIANIALEDELYAIGFRKGDPLRDRVNQAMKELYDDGTLTALAVRYGVDDRFFVDTSYRG